MAVEFTSLEKDSKQGLFECPVTRSSFFSRLAAAKLTAMYFRVPEERDTSLDNQLEMYAASGEEELASMSIHTNWGIAMQHMRFSGESMYSRSKQRLDIQRARQLVTMSLATLGVIDISFSPIF